MEDHHVDRPQVEAWQHVQPSGPNRSIELTRSSTKPKPLGGRPVLPTSPHASLPRHVPHPPAPRSPRARWLRRPGGHSERDPPDPIPNSAVKPPSAHGTASPRRGRVGRRQASQATSTPPSPPTRTLLTTNTPAGWSSPVARQAHNLKVVGSNPTPATKIYY